MRPVLCLVTDRQRLGSAAALVRRVAAAARAGVHLVQVRERDLEGGALRALVTDCVAAVNGTRTRVIVNDRVDVALAAGAHGVHLRSDSVPAARVRALVPPGFLIGRSVHSVVAAEQCWRDGGADYLIFGHVFATSSKAGARAAGPDALAAVAASVPLPVLAIGGITAGNASSVAHAGAAGIAAIGLFLDPADADLSVTVARVRAAFDSDRTVP